MNDYSYNKSAFIGKIVAASTHELKNVFATLEELVGLLEDILIIKKLTDDKIISCFERIKKQFFRGRLILKHLNKFSHCADNKIYEINVVNTIKTILFLSERFLNIKNIKYEIIDEKNIKLITDSIIFQMCIFEIFICISKDVHNGYKVVIHCYKNRNYVVLEFINIPIVSIKEMLQDENYKKALNEIKAKIELKKPSSFSSNVLLYFEDLKV